MGVFQKLKPALPSGAVPVLRRVAIVCGCICFLLGCAGFKAHHKKTGTSTTAESGSRQVDYYRPRKPLFGLWRTAWKTIDEHGNGQNPGVLNPITHFMPPNILFNNLYEHHKESRFDLPIVHTAEVERFIRYYHKRRKIDFQRRIARSQRFILIMKKIFREHSLPEDLVYVALVESGFHPMAESNANAVGIWQFTRATAKHYGLRISHWYDERKDPVKSTVAAAMYLSDLYSTFNDWYLALAGYNAGTGTVLRATKLYHTTDFWTLARRNALPKQTRDYVPKILAAICIAKQPEKYGFTNIAGDPPLRYEDLLVVGNINIRKFARWLGIRSKELKALNPELLGNSIYADSRGYRIHLPEKTIERFLSQHGCKLPNIKWKFACYRTKPGENLYVIANQFGTDPLIISQANDLLSLLKVSSTKNLLIPVPTQSMSGTNLAMLSVKAASEDMSTRKKALASRLRLLPHASEFMQTLLTDTRVEKASGFMENKYALNLPSKKRFYFKAPRFFSRLFPGSRYLFSISRTTNS